MLSIPVPYAGVCDSDHTCEVNFSIAQKVQLYFAFSFCVSSNRRNATFALKIRLTRVVHLVLRGSNLLICGIDDIQKD